MHLNFPGTVDWQSLQIYFIPGTIIGWQSLQNYSGIESDTVTFYCTAYKKFYCQDDFNQPITHFDPLGDKTF